MTYAVLEDINYSRLAVLRTVEGLSSHLESPSYHRSKMKFFFAVSLNFLIRFVALSHAVPSPITVIEKQQYFSPCPLSSKIATLVVRFLQQGHLKLQCTASAISSRISYRVGLSREGRSRACRILQGVYGSHGHAE